MLKEASFYERGTEGKVRCRLCPFRCVISAGKRGLCNVRENREGTLYSLVYGRLIAANVDPIEKKPLFHFYPGSTSFSIATQGCNFRCQHCQNASISQVEPEENFEGGREVSPKEIVEAAQRAGCRSISYTYTEPTIYLEYALDTARLASSAGIANVFVTNGYMEEEPLREVAPFLDAANVDLKAFRDDFYKRFCGGARLEGVLRALRLMKELGVWVEVTTLLIPGLNDTGEELEDIARFIAELGPEIPWHVSRFHPSYKMTDRPPTPPETIARAVELGRSAGLRYVYAGNLPGSEAESTFCFKCKALLIERWGFSIRRHELVEGSCPRCGEPLDGVGLERFKAA